MSCQKRVQFVCIGDSPDSHEVINGVVACLDRPLVSLNGDDIAVAPAGAPPCEACQATHRRQPQQDGDACPKCGALNRPDARQCHACGNPAPTPD